MSDPSRAGGAKPAPAEALELSDRLWRAFNARDWDALWSLTTDDFTTRTDPRWPGGGEFTNREEQQRFFEQFLEPWEVLRYERTADAVLVNDRLIERGAWVGIGRATGIEGRIDFTVVTELEGRLIKRSDFFISHDEALAYAERGGRSG